MKSEQTSPGQSENVRKALARPDSAGLDVCEDFRSARSSLGRITADLERLRQHAATLVKGARRQAK